MKDFDKLVDEAARDIHSGLLEGGGKEMKSRVFKWLSYVLEAEKKEARPSRKKVSAVRLAERIRDEIMKNGSGNKAERLQLRDKGERDLGGWGDGPLRDVIQSVIEKSGVCE